MTGLDLELLVRERCHLCEEFLLQFSIDQPDRTGSLRLRDVDREPALAAEFGLRVPVLRVGGRVVSEGRYDRSEVLASLQV